MSVACHYIQPKNTYRRMAKGGWRLNLGIETETREFKKFTGELKEAMYSICAMLNKHQHGELYFGVKSDGTPIGQGVSEETLRMVSHKIGEAIKPLIYLEVKKVILDGKECVHIKFEGNQLPYFAFGLAKIRVADEDITMSPEQITKLILDSGRERNRWENLTSNKKIDDVDEDLLKQYTNKAHEAGRIAITYTDKETVLNQLERTEIPEIPVDAIREALLNSFCHKDYASGESNEVAIYKDRVEIYNPGAFPEGYDPQYFIDKPSRPIRRNPKIARTLYYSKDIESFGTGLKRISEVCDEAGVKYEFQKLRDGFVVCFYRSSYRESTDKVRVSTGKVRVNNLTESQERIVRYLLEYKKITNKEVCGLLDVKESRAYKILSEMNKKGS